MSKLKPYPRWCCFDCGNKYGKSEDGVSTFHMGKCGVCGKITDVTEVRDWNYPDFPRHKKQERINNPLMDI